MKMHYAAMEFATDGTVRHRFEVINERGVPLFSIPVSPTEGESLQDQIKAAHLGLARQLRRWAEQIEADAAESSEG
ncbi:MAG: hypothetical protein RL268_175 [Pseudomonadota bacterium]|jgi:hypothetical protein